MNLELIQEETWSTMAQLTPILQIYHTVVEKQAVAAIYVHVD